MKIKEMFVKPIDRNIQGVIKVGQKDDVYIRQELEEYVVTNELKKHFKIFFEKYTEGMSGNTDKIGVWISGFFGSGKSHFLKILSYLLENREIGGEQQASGKKAIDYFQDSKIDDNHLIANMKRVADEAINTDVILFNIDSKNSSGSGDERDPIVTVFLKVFNEMLGYCYKDPHIADLERHLEEQNKLEDFKNIFFSKNGRSWDEARFETGFIQDDIIEAITDVGLMSREAARNWCEKTSTPYNISNEDLAYMIKKYLNRKGKNHRILFLIDEMGQFIGQDSRLMLNLQTLVEDFGRICQGRAWVIVTSQEDIDSITQNMAARSNDFSKIQGRFDTRLSLSSADVGEVIRKRILEKTFQAYQTLSLLYEKKATVIRNLIMFSNTAQKKLYENADNFAADYPFVPYQFDLLGNVLTAIRKHGASGKHLAQGERSMLAMFKESANRLSAESAGSLVPFNMFYDALEQFLDSSHRSVIQSALRNEIINPEKKENCLEVNVLKTLFLIKYVKEITATLENITSLMCTSIDEDRIALTGKIETALKILQNETLVSRNSDVYIFLTNEEQEVNREIDRQNIVSADVIQSASLIIFNEIINEDKYKLSHLNGRYSYPYNQKVDDYQFNHRYNHPVTLQILTPDNDTSSLHMKSSQLCGVLAVLPSHINFLDELRRQLRIEKYLRSGSYQTLQRAKDIERELHDEHENRKKTAKSLLEDALREARIFVRGNEEKSGNKDIKSKIYSALDNAINSVYYNLSYIDTALNIDNIHEIFIQDNTVPGYKPNRHALDDMRNFIDTNSSKYQKTSMRTLQDRYMKAPYGYIEEDVEWLCVKLFKDGDINVYINNAQVTIQDKPVNELISYFTKKQYIDSLTTEIRRKANETQLKNVREIMKALFNDSVPDNDEDMLYKNFKEYGKILLEYLKDLFYKSQMFQKFKGQVVIQTGIQLLQTLLRNASPILLFEELSKMKNDILDFTEDYENVKSFFSGSQCEIFLKAEKAVQSFELNKNFITNNNTIELAVTITAITNMDNPYGEISKLPELTERLTKDLFDECEKDRVTLLEVLEEKKNDLFAKLEGKSYKDELKSIFNKRFDTIKNKIIEIKELYHLKSMNYEIAWIYTDSLNKIETKNAELADTTAETPKRLTRYIPIKSLISSPSWRIETKDDIDTYLKELKNRISAEMKNDDIISVEF